MDPGSVIVVVLALMRVLPALLGPKTCRKLGVGAILEELRARRLAENDASAR